MLNMRGSLDSSKNNMCNAYKTKKEIIMNLNTISHLHGRLGMDNFMKTLEIKCFLLKDNSGLQGKSKLEDVSCFYLYSTNMHGIVYF